VVAVAATYILYQMKPYASASCITILVAIVAGMVAPVLLLANLRLVLKTLRQRRLVKQLGLQEISYSAWRAHRKRRLFVRIGGALLTLLAIALLIGMVSLVWQSGFKASEIPVLLLFFAVAATPIAWRLVQRSRQQLEVLDDADSLRATLTSIQAAPGDTVVVPAAVLEKVAGIERAQIARERTQAVLAGVKNTNRGYGVLIAKEVSEQKAALPPDRRLDVEELIDELMAEPYLSAADGRGGGVRNARTPDGSAEIDYSVDEQNQRIQVVALRTTHVF
jgi:hypothetical protein